MKKENIFIDNFLNFWFRFIYTNYSTIENENFTYVKQILTRDYSTYSGIILEKLYHELFWSSKKFNRIGSYWEKGNQNEIDLVAFNDLEKRCVIADIKINPAKINLPLLKKKSQKIINTYQKYEVQYLGLSFSDLAQYLTP